MRNLIKRISALLLCLLLVLSLPVTALAEEAKDTDEAAAAEEGTTLRILRQKQFLDFAENCRLDSYSRNLSVVLLTDIDLTGVDFAGIPIFCGNFDGNGHTISGLSITQVGSNMGLFRYVDASALIQNLTVSGEIIPDGSRSAVGGIAGHNAGKVQNCFFDGTVSGSDDVGGIAGINAITGIIDGCHSKGVITGDHRVGGVVGNNLGVVRSCNNRSGGNTTAEENQVKLSDISLETITGSESVSTVTDIGGIAGTSSGIIRQIKNRGNVGYQHMGYNVGGIAGTQTGYLYKCENFAQVYGRKEVGGIVGQIAKGDDGLGRYVINCYSRVDQLEAKHNDVGGIAGIVSDDSFVVNCYSTLADVSQNDSFASSVGYNKKGNVQNVYGNEACPSGKKNPDWIVGNDSKQDGSVWAESLGLLLSLDEMKSGAVTVPSSGQECASFTEALNAGAEIYASTPAETLPAKPTTAVRKWVDSDTYPVLE